MRASALAAAMLLAACAAEKTPEAQPSPVATRAVPRTLIPADLDPEADGLPVKGMEIRNGVVGNRKAPLARYDALVLCADDAVPVCDPKLLPADTVYTYILTITPVASLVEADETPEVAATEGALVQEIAPAEVVGTMKPVPEFKGVVGFAMKQAAAALGAEDALSVALDQNRLIWRVTGGRGWQPGKPITLWWRSARPPAKAAPAYHIEYGGKSAAIYAPFPADKAVEQKAPR